MKKIRVLATPASKLANIDFYQFVTAQANRIKGLGDTTLTDADLRQLVVVLLSLSEDFNKALFQVRKNLKTGSIVEKDHVRDFSFSALRSGIRNATYSLDADVQHAAAALTILLNTYGDVASMPFDKESGSIDKLIEELEGASYKAFVEKLGLAANVTRLKADNDAFKVLFNERRDETVAKTNLDAISLRRQVNDQYTLLCDYVLLRCRMSDAAQYVESLKIINTIREEFNRIVAQHKASKKSANDPKGEPKDKSSFNFEDMQ